MVGIERTTGQTWIQKFYCITTNTSESRTDVIGRCLSSTVGQAFIRYALPLPCNVSNLNEYMCSVEQRGSAL